MYFQVVVIDPAKLESESIHRFFKTTAARDAWHYKFETMILPVMMNIIECPLSEPEPKANNMKTIPRNRLDTNYSWFRNL
jgi:hypothetical protein